MRVLGVVLTGFLALAAFGCGGGPSQEEFSRATQERDAARAELKEAQTDLRETQERVSELEDKLLAARPAAPAKTPAATTQKPPAPVTVAVPSLIGERLDVAEATLREKGLRYSEIGGGSFGIVVRSNWVVCETRPGAATEVKKRTRIRLIVDREC